MSHTLPELADALQTTFTAVADQAARVTGFIRRRRTLTGAAFVRGLVFTWLRNPQATWEELAGGVTDAGSSLAVSSLVERCDRRGAACLLRVLEHAAGRLVAADGALAPALRPFTDVCIDDSSVIALPAALASVWPGCGGRTPDSCPAALKLYVRLSLRSGALHALQLHGGRTCDQTAPLQRLPVPGGGLRVADLGFFDLDTLQAQHRQGAYFLSKVQVGTLLANPDGVFTDLLGHLGRYRGAQLDRAVLLGKRHRLPVRLLAVRLPRRVVKQRQKRVRAEAKRKRRPPSPQLLALCRWLVLVTNAPPEKMALAWALALYRARWQIELLFKLWKGLGEIDQSRSGKPERVLCEVYGKLLAMVVQHWLLLLGVWRYPNRSLYKAAKRVRERAIEVADGLGDGAALRRALERIMKGLERGCRVQCRRKQPSTFQRLHDATLLECTET